jgi:hypothetical protein
MIEKRMKLEELSPREHTFAAINDQLDDLTHAGL